MKLSCLPVSFFQDIINGKMTVIDWAKMGKKLGFDAVDLSILFLEKNSPSQIVDLKKMIDDLGMRIAMVTSYPDFTQSHLSERLKALDLEMKVIETARLIGAQMVRVTAGQAHPGINRQDGINWAVEGLTQLGTRTKDWNIQLVYENHSKPGAWIYTDFSEPPDIFLAIAHQLKNTSVGINFDAGNAATFSDDPVKLLEEVIDQVISIHASDSRIKGSLQHVLLGTGITPYSQIFQTLKKHGWDGWICIEEASFLGEEGVRKAASYVRNCWQGLPS